MHYHDNDVIEINFSKISSQIVGKIILELQGNMFYSYI